jgi:hypothetical protein
MLHWLSESMTLGSTLSPSQIAVRLVTSATFGVAVALIFWASHGRTKEDRSTLIATLVLLPILIAMVSMVIGDNVARAFSLVGALAIVRFRTVVEDTRDTAFVIFAVIVGMASGAGLILVPLLGTPLVGIVAIILSRFDNFALEPETGYLLSIRIGQGLDPEQTLNAVLVRHLAQYRLTSLETARQGSAIDVSYRARMLLSSNLPALVRELSQVEGVLRVEGTLTSK